jgi:hypothetical protein
VKEPPCRLNQTGAKRAPVRWCAVSVPCFATASTVGSRWPHCSARGACPVQQRRWPATRCHLRPRPFRPFLVPLYTMPLDSRWCNRLECRRLRPYGTPQRQVRPNRSIAAIEGRLLPGELRRRDSCAPYLHGDPGAGERQPDAGHIVRIAKGLELSLSELFEAVEKDTG